MSGLSAEDELRHLREGSSSAELPDEGLVRYTVRATDPAAVVDRAADVLGAVLELGSPVWPSLDRWRSGLPRWFVGGCAPELSTDERASWLAWWRSLDPPARIRAEADRAWALSDWLSWLEPGGREWFWWDVDRRADDADVLVMVLGWPYPDGALRWLLRVAGATSVFIA